MENFNQYCLDHKDFISSKGFVIVELKDLINKLDICFKKDNENFAETCFVVFRIKKLFDKYKQVRISSCKNDTYNFDTIMQGFGICKSESCRLLSCYNKFCCLSCSDLEVAKCNIIEEFSGFSKSKLFELLQVDNMQIIKDLHNKVIRFDFTIKQLRDYVKNIQALNRQQAQLNEQQEEKVEEDFNYEDIPMVYDPQHHYDFNYFEVKNKAQLLNIVWELQKEYERLKENYNKLKRRK